MPINTKGYQELAVSLKERNVTLVAVSKTKSVQDIQELYDLGQRDFGENYVQELTDKHSQLPGDIKWHFIGHLQTNKVKYIAPFVYLIQSVDSFKLLREINKEAKKTNRVIDCLLQVHIAEEETKFGFDEKELAEAIKNAEELSLTNIRISGLMGMASFTDDRDKIRAEFKNLYRIFKTLLVPTPRAELSTLSSGMSSDYKLAIEEGSNMVRIGSLIFGQRH